MNYPKGRPVLQTLANLFEALLQSLKAHKWWWAGGGTAAILVIAAGVAYSVYGESWFGPSGKTICTAALSDARDYGVVPNDSALASNEAKQTKVDGRRICTAQSGSDTYLITADVTCKKIKDGKCLTLYAVERSDGLSTYQVRSVPDDETAADVPPVDAGGSQQSDQAAAPPAQAAPAAAQSASQDSSPDDSLETVKPGGGSGMNAQPSSGGDQPQQ